MGHCSCNGLNKWCIKGYRKQIKIKKKRRVRDTTWKYDIFTGEKFKVGVCFFLDALLTSYHSVKCKKARWSKRLQSVGVFENSLHRCVPSIHVLLFFLFVSGMLLLFQASDGDIYVALTCERYFKNSQRIRYMCLTSSSNERMKYSIYAQYVYGGN